MPGFPAWNGNQVSVPTRHPKYRPAVVTGSLVTGPWVAAGCPERCDALTAESLRDVKPHPLLEPAMTECRSCTSIPGKLANDNDVGFQHRYRTAKRARDGHGFKITAHRLSGSNTSAKPIGLPQGTHSLAKACVERAAIRGDVGDSELRVL
jgi:hypothetical protein